MHLLSEIHSAFSSAEYTSTLAQRFWTSTLCVCHTKPRPAHSKQCLRSCHICRGQTRGNQGSGVSRSQSWTVIASSHQFPEARSASHKSSTVVGLSLLNVIAEEAQRKVARLLKSFLQQSSSGLNRFDENTSGHNL